MSKELYCRICNRTTEHYYHQRNNEGIKEDLYYCSDCGSCIGSFKIGKGLLKKINEAKKL